MSKTKTIIDEKKRLLLIEKERNKETCQNLIGVVMKSMERRDKECSFKFVSILSKAKSGGISVTELLRMCGNHIPKVVKEWNKYIRTT